MRGERIPLSAGTLAPRIGVAGRRQLLAFGWNALVPALAGLFVASFYALYPLFGSDTIDLGILVIAAVGGRFGTRAAFAGTVLLLAGVALLVRPLGVPVLDVVNIPHLFIALAVGVGFGRAHNVLRSLRARTGSLQEAHARIQLILDNAPIMLYALDDEGVFTLSEGSGLATLGLRPGQVVGASAFELFADLPESLEPVRSALAGTAARSTVVGQGWVFDATHFPVHDNAGRVTGLVGVAFDVTARESALTRLRLVNSAIEHVGDGVVITDAASDDPVIRYANPAFLALSGLAAAELVGLPFSAARRVIVPDMERTARRQAAAARGKRFDSEVEIRRGDGSILTTDVRFAPVRDASGRTVSFVSLWHDVTERRHAQREHDRRAAHLSSIIERSFDAVVSADADGHVVDWNPSAEAMFGWSKAEALGRLLEEVTLPPILRGAVKARHDDVATRAGGVIVREVVVSNGMDRTRRVFPVEMVTTRHEGESGALYTTFIRDISERVRHAEQLEHMALYDPLTELPNRTLLQDRFEIALAGALRDGATVAFAILDIDDFKHVNDTYGHATGDQLLREVARRFDASLPATDTIARLSGDEFAAVLGTIGSPDQAEATVQKLLATLSAPLVIDGHAVRFTASAGWVMVSGQDAPFASVMSRAYLALDTAKRARPSVQQYTESLSLVASDELDLQAALPGAIRNGELVLHYQPIVDLASGRCVSLEALVRWQHPQLGLLPPARFVAIAERSGLAVPLGLWVIERAAEEAGAWSSEAREFRIAVNLAPDHLRRTDLAQTVTALLATKAIDPGRLIVEVTEGAIIGDPARMGEGLRELRAAGIQVAMDDFGVGFSSFAYLQQLPLDTLKLDRSFVALATQDARSHAIVKAAIDLAHGMDLTIVAEGVEDEATRDLLRAAGCDLAQGYLFARPMPADQCVAWLRRQ